MNEQVQLIPIDSLIPSPGNRKITGVDVKNINSLAESIKISGVIQPAIVRKKDEGYEIIAGHRRWMASKAANIGFLPCIVKEMDDTEALITQSVENLQREDIHPLDESEIFIRLYNSGESPESIAESVGKTPAFIYQRMKLDNLIPKIKKVFIAGQLQVSHATQMARLDAEQQESVAEVFLTPWRIKNGFSSDELTSWIDKNVMHVLAGTTWDKKDATLVPTAGSCEACSKRTGANLDLFDDISPKKDQCLDPVCYLAKRDAIVAIRKEELKGVGHILVSDTYYTGKESIVSSENWKECKKSDEGAVRGLIVHGDKVGKLVWAMRKVKMGKTLPSGQELSFEQAKKADRKNELLVIKCRNEVLGEAYKTIRSLANLKLDADLEKCVPLFKVLCEKFWGRLAYDSKATVAKAEGWTKEKDDRWDEIGLKLIEKIDHLSDAFDFMVMIATASESKMANNQYYGIPSTYTDLAAILDVDIPAIAREIGVRNAIDERILLNDERHRYGEESDAEEDEGIEEGEEEDEEEDEEDE